MPSPFTRDQLSPAMRERYGMDRRPVGRIVGVAVLILAFVGVLAFVTMNLFRNPVEYRLVTWDVQGPDHVDVTFSVDRPADATATCVLRAQDSTHVDLGYAVVEVPPGEGGVLVDYSLATLAPAFAVELLGCSVNGTPGVPPAQFPPGVVPPDQPWTAA